MLIKHLMKQSRTKTVYVLTAGLLCVCALRVIYRYDMTRVWAHLMTQSRTRTVYVLTTGLLRVCVFRGTYIWGMACV